jgi:hypothetical protein
LWYICYQSFKTKCTWNTHFFPFAPRISALAVRPLLSFSPAQLCELGRGRLSASVTTEWGTRALVHACAPTRQGPDTALRDGMKRRCSNTICYWSFSFFFLTLREYKKWDLCTSFWNLRHCLERVQWWMS